MSIFQKSVVNKYLKNLDNEKVLEAYNIFKKFYGNMLRITNIIHLKEENYQEGFLREIFVNVLGYSINPDVNFNLTTEYKNRTDSKKADGAIIQNNTAIGVIELKSTKTFFLENITNQAFNYKHNQPDCRYVITSNFHYLRFYIDNSTEYEEFDLFEMANCREKSCLAPSSEFEKFYLILSKESIFNDIPLKMKEETKFHEENISDKFYKDYKEFKDQIFENLIKNNPQYDKLTLFRKSQKLLDRFLFVYFAEDCGLCPPNSIQKIIDSWKILKANDAYAPLFSRFQKLFNYLNVGKKFENYEYPAFNGGLFKNDELLDDDKTLIDDKILLLHCPKLSTYDFNTEIDVNILGHIFEHSLNEIEEITAELNGETIDKTKSKRKKDGVFYTPKYITNYIVENTIGKLCKDKQNELQISDIEINETYVKNGKTTKPGKDLFTKFQEYKNWLFTLKILDPACGSGAFLNAALDFLMKEHQQIDDFISNLTGDKIRMFDTDKNILENNIFGVDINEESVEIAKLSLWLRTAKKGRQLSDLNGNIKCGNSLIDNKEIAGEKAFDWHKEFPQIFGIENIEIEQIIIKKEEKPDYLKLIKEKSQEAKQKAEQAIELSQEVVELTKRVYEYAEKLETVNEPETKYISKNIGFDVIIGNPPYVRQENIKKTEKDYLSRYYEVGNGVADLYVYFYNVGINLLKHNGILGYITPNKWFKTKYGFNLRNFIKQFQIIEIYDFFELRIFQDASTEPQIIIIQNKNSSDNFNYYPVSSTAEFISSQVKPSIIDKKKLNSDSWILAKNDNNTILAKIYENTLTLKEYTKNGIEYGIKTGLNKAFIIDEATKNKLLQEDTKSEELIKKYISGTDIGKWIVNFKNEYLIFTRRGTDIENYPAIKKYLLQFYEELRPRNNNEPTGRKPGKYQWFEIQDSIEYYEKFETPKILYIHTAVNHNFYYDTENYYLNNSCYFITNADKFLACWLNSTVFDFLKRLIFVAYGDASEKGRAKLDSNKMVNIPIPKLTEQEKQPFYEKADIMLTLNKELQSKIDKFIKRIKSNFTNINITTKLADFYKFDFNTYIAELKKQKFELILKIQDDWEEYFDTYKKDINNLQFQILKIKNEINKMVYELYNLTPEEIALVEGTS